MIWLRRLLPMLLGAGLLYLCWRLVTANGTPVEVDFVAGRLEGVALWKALGSSFVLGASIVGFALVIQMTRAKLVARTYRKKLSGLETEVHQLRNLPLAPEDGVPDRGPDGVPDSVPDVVRGASQSEAVPTES